MTVGKRKVSFQSFWSLIIVFTKFIDVDTLRNVHVIIPLIAKPSETVTLQCKYDLEGELLYTVKWYKGRDEFFHYIPRETPNKNAFELAGAKLDLEKSDASQVVLRHVTAEATGRYKCEVSTDAPNFDTRMEAGFMYVVDVPKGDVELKVDKMSNENGHVIRANCTTPPSFPPMNITWFLNGIKIKPQMTTVLNPPKIYDRGKRISLAVRSYVETELDQTFQPSATSTMIRIQCIGSLFHLYRREKVEYIEDDRPRPSSIVLEDVQESISGSSRLKYAVTILFVTIILRRFLT